MNTKTLIQNIENLSATLSQNQLVAFLDIMDAVAAMAAESQELAKQNKSTPSIQVVTQRMH